MDQPANISFDDVLAHASWARQLASALVADAASAEDLVQDTWVAALRAKPEETLSTRAWLSRVMRNLARDRWRRAERRERREIAAAKHEATASSADLAAELEMQRALITALSEIDESLRITLIRRFFHGASTSDIARVEGISDRTVRDRIERGLAALRSKLDRKFGDRSTWSALLMPLARSGMSNVGPLPSSVVPSTGVMTVGATLKSIAALVIAVGIVAWLARRDTVHQDSVPGARPSRELLANATNPPIDLSDRPAESARAAVAIASPASDAELTVRVVGKQSRQPGRDIYTSVSAVRPHVDPPGAEPRSGEEVEIAHRRTNSDGLVNFKVLPRVPLRVAQSGGRPQTDLHGEFGPLIWSRLDIDPLAPGEHRDVTVEADDVRQFSFWARFISDEDGRPIANIIVRALDVRDLDVEPDWKESPRERILEGDADGFVELRMTYAQRYTLQLLAGAPDFGPAIFWPLDGHEKRDRALDIKLARSASLRAKVVDRRNKDHAVLSVRLRVPSYSLTAATDLHALETEPSIISVSWRAACDAQGECEFPQLPSVVFTVDVFDGDKSVLTIPEIPPDWLSLKPGEARSVEWKLGGGTIVRGLALDENRQPVRRHEIWLLRNAVDALMNDTTTCFLKDEESEFVAARALTNDQGRFEFPSVDSGAWWVGIAPSRDANAIPASGRHTNDPKPIAVHFEIGANEKETEVTIQPPSALFIRGRVVQPDGAPMGKAWIEIGKGVLLSTHTFSEADGGFELGPLEAGVWRVRAAKFDQYAPSNTVEVPAGTSNVKLQMRLAGSISGDVKSETPDSEGAIVLTCTSETNGSMSTETNGPGPLHIQALPPGTWDVVARSRSGSFAIVRRVVVEAGKDTTGVVLALARGGTITARYHGKESECAFQIMSDSAFVSYESVPTGSWKKFAAPACRVTLRRETSAGRVDREVIVHAGADSEIELDDP